jgi:hypothetical protein
VVCSDSDTQAAGSPPESWDSVGLGRFSLKLLRITLPHSVTPVGMAAIITYCIVAVGARFFLQIASNNNYRFHFRAVQSRQLAQLLPVAVSITKLLMGLGKTSSVVVACYRRAASAGLALSSRATGTTTQPLARTCARRPRVLYIDRGVIVLNKPPGLVSQGTSSIAPVAAKTTTPPTRTAFDDVLDGTVTTLFIFIVLLCLLY